MRFLSFALFMFVAALCFMAGYKVGKESPSPTYTRSANGIEDALRSEPTDIDDFMPIIKAPSVNTAADLDRATQHPLAERAKEPVQTFFDTNGRKLVAKILEVRADSLTVQRQSDGQELHLPLYMLVAEDQAFVAYLKDHQDSKPANDSLQSMEDKIWDELFR